ncbi:hypothetical protein [Leptolyngbya sp. FACHB-17]|uniref:hypothetical protein n=1 Tax=unclassified Leptolyngbya TaxID=2650499 RepID=UPI0016816968|nr:hypothetical protein [Leptolyngbya sp. FACHB-17]MBD2080428.1 hypothetical protein [Leptolyngbya sp. FACHB-17]
MCDAEPKTIRFSTTERPLAGKSKRSQTVRVGLALASLPEGFAQNGSGYLRVRYLEAEEIHQIDVLPDQLLPLERARVRVRNNQADIIQDAIALLEIG